MPVGTQAKIEQELRLLLLGGNQSNDILTKALSNLLSFNVSDEAVLVRLTDKIARGDTGHSDQPAVA